jgi:glycerophosphoryl diester phosphodiesterase
MMVIGHRGAAALAPENTWASFDVALELGVDAIETDIRATSDGELVLIHDEELDRTTDGQGPIRATPWSVVSQLDAGSWYDAAFGGARIPCLDDTLLRYGQRTQLVLEIKQAGIELQVLELVQRLNLLGRVTFTSFDFEVVRHIKAQAKTAWVGFLTPDTGQENVERVLAAHLDQFCPPASSVTPSQVRRWKELGLEVRAWGVRNHDLMLQAIQAKVDGMTVDFPHLLLKALGRES